MRRESLKHYARPSLVMTLTVKRTIKRIFPFFLVCIPISACLLVSGLQTHSTEANTVINCAIYTSNREYTYFDGTCRAEKNDNGYTLYQVDGLKLYSEVDSIKLVEDFAARGYRAFTIIDQAVYPIGNHPIRSGGDWQVCLTGNFLEICHDEIKP